MFDTVRKIEQIQEIETTITLPAKNYFVLNQMCARFCYFKDAAIKYINFPTRYDFGKLLEKHGFIKKCVGSGNNVLLKKEGFEIQMTGKKGEFVQCPIEVELKWNEITLTRSEVKGICACHEWETTFKKSFLNFLNPAA